MKDLPGREAGSQCDAIAITLERMSKLTWTDAKGLEWPRWIGFELQKCHTKVAADDADESMDEDDSKKKGKAKADKAKTTRKRRRPTPPAPVPSWLEDLCSSDATGQNHVHIGDRRGARYTFKQLANIVRSIKSYCINQDARLPAVEALPVTMGLHAEAEVKSAKEAINAPLRLYNLAIKEVSDAKTRGKRIRPAEQERDEREVELEAAKQRYAEALKDLEASKETLPERRKPKKAAKKVEEDADDNDEVVEVKHKSKKAAKKVTFEDDEDDDDEAVGVRRKPKKAAKKVAFEDDGDDSDDDEIEEVEPPKKRLRRGVKPKPRFVESDTDME